MWHLQLEKNLSQSCLDTAIRAINERDLSFLLFSNEKASRLLPFDPPSSPRSWGVKKFRTAESGMVRRLKHPDFLKDVHGKVAFKISCTKGEERLSHTKIMKSPCKDPYEPISLMECLGFGSTARWKRILFYPKATYPKSKEWNMTIWLFLQLQTSGKQNKLSHWFHLVRATGGYIISIGRGLLVGGLVSRQVGWGKTWKSWAGTSIIGILEAIKDSWDSRVPSFKMKRFVWTVGFKPCT